MFTTLQKACGQLDPGLNSANVFACVSSIFKDAYLFSSLAISNEVERKGGGGKEWFCIDI